MKNKKRFTTSLVLSFLIFLFVVPLILAIILYVKEPAWLHYRTANKGQLLSLSHDFFLLKKISSHKIIESPINNKYWFLFYLANTECKHLCQINLYNMHQIKVALGKNSSQLNYGLIQVQANMEFPIKNKFINQDPNLLRYWISVNELKKFFSTLMTEKKVEGYYLVDPVGKIVLYYPKAINPSDIYQDLTRLLTYSTIG